MPPTRKSRSSASRGHLSRVPSHRHCGLCGKRDGLPQTECCQQWICDDAHAYELFSYARNSCCHNHGRFTLCGYPYNERHRGEWKTYEPCRNAFSTELYVYFGTKTFPSHRGTDVCGGWPGGADADCRARGKVTRVAVPSACRPGHKPPGE